MRRVLRRLAGLGKEPEQVSRFGGSLDLRQSDVAGNDGENVIQIMRDAAREGAGRFELARRQPFGLALLSFADVAEKNRDTAVAGVRAHFVPNFPAAIASLKFHPNLLRHDLLVVGLKNRADQFRKSFPEDAAE